jgi:hypothetical protein
LAQSYIGMANKRAGGRIKTENHPLDPAPPKAMKQTVELIRQLEAMVPAAPFITGIVLRYGSFYGPGTAVAPGILSLRWCGTVNTRSSAVAPECGPS